MTLRDRLFKQIRDRCRQSGPWIDECLEAVLATLPVTLSQLEMIERGEMVVVPKPGHSDAERPAGMMG